MRTERYEHGCYTLLFCLAYTVFDLTTACLIKSRTRYGTYYSSVRAGYPGLMSVHTQYFTPGMPDERSRYAHMKTLGYAVRLHSLRLYTA